MLILPLEPMIVREPGLPEEVLKMPLRAFEVVQFQDMIAGYAKDAGYSLGIKRVLEHYTRRLFENYFALPTDTAHEDDCAWYHILVRDGTAEQLVHTLANKAQEQEYVHELVQHYMQRFHLQLANNQVSEGKDMQTKIKNLFGVYHIPYQQALVDEALYGYVPGNKNSEQGLAALLENCYLLLYHRGSKRSEQEVSNSLFNNPISKRDLTIRYESDFTMMADAIMRGLSPVFIASLMSNDANRFDQYDDANAALLVSSAREVLHYQGFLGIFLYIFHFHMKQDLVEFTSWYGNRLLVEKQNDTY